MPYQPTTAKSPVDEEAIVTADSVNATAVVAGFIRSAAALAVIANSTDTTVMMSTATIIAADHVPSHEHVVAVRC